VYTIGWDLVVFQYILEPGLHAWFKQPLTLLSLLIRPDSQHHLARKSAGPCRTPKVNPAI